MRNYLVALSVVFLAALAGCAGLDFGSQPAPPPRTVQQVEADTWKRSSNPAAARANLEATAQKGQYIGDVAYPEPEGNIMLMADSIVVGLEGRGTDRYDAKMKPYLVKLLVKNYDSLQVASEIINSKDACPVRVVAHMPPFVRKDEKFDVTVESLDPNVNIEGGTLVDTPLVRYIQMPADMTHLGFRTQGGFVSEGTQGYARGDVTLNAGYRSGAPLKGEVPYVGYVPAGGISSTTWGHRLFLKKSDAATSVLIDAALKGRFQGPPDATGPKTLVTSPTSDFIAVGMPNAYHDYWKRYLDVVMRVPLRAPSRQERDMDVDRQIAALNSADPHQRYEAECAIEAYGRVTGSALLEALRTLGPQGKQSALRVLAFVDEPRAVDPLIEESRRAQGRFRAESPYLLSLLSGDRGPHRKPEIERINARLIEMLDDTDAEARFRALEALERNQVATDRVKEYYSEMRTFNLSLVESGAEPAIVVRSLDGVRHVAVFGAGQRLRCPFRGSCGPVTLNVTADGVEILHKRHEAKTPTVLKTHDLTDIIVRLDRMYVSVNDIVGLLDQLDKRGGLEAKMYWVE